MFMRPLILCVMILMVPFVNAVSNPIEENNIGFSERGVEVILVSEGEAWTQKMWNDLAGSGFEPLRMSGPNSLLAWKSPGATPLVDYHQKEAFAAEWRGSMVVFDQGFSGEAKVLFEPRLSDSALDQTINEMRSWGLEIEDYPVKGISVMPKEIKTTLWNGFEISELLSIDGVLWVEPVLETVGRNVASAGLMGSGELTNHPQWSFGLNGDGVVLGVADSGIDDDHACFRNATAQNAEGSENGGLDAVADAGIGHRKILINNETLDGGDNQGDMDYRHGTHVSGTLACHNIYDYRSGSKPSNGSTMSYASQLVFQDIVSNEGWVPPDNVTDLLLENSLAGGVIHSNSWGDDTVEYTARSADFDLWSVEVPWSLAFIAPGNTGGQLLEPANARNVVAVGASTKSEQPILWASSSIGPTEAGTDGIFVIAPGTSISSAKADGIDDSLNDELRPSSGTSMATPMAASFAGVLQQMVEGGWIMGVNEIKNVVNFSEISPQWQSLPDGEFSLGQGFTPSGSLLRSLMAISTSDLVDDNGYFQKNNQTGWGVLNLSELIDFGALENNIGAENLTPTENIWIHDSYRNSFDFQNWLSSRLVDSSSTSIGDIPWNGAGAEGPFLQSGEVWTKRLEPNGDEDLEVVMSFAAKPEPYLVDDIQLVVRFPDGRFSVGGIYDFDGFSSVYTENTMNLSSLPNSNETSLGISISKLELEDVGWVDVEVRAKYISPGNAPGTVGIDGDRIGFAIAAKGVERDSVNWEDSDGDGIANVLDLCPNHNPQEFDLDLDGCSDDSDGDGISDQYDSCPETNSSGFDIDLDGCIDDSDNDGVKDNVDLCETLVIDSNYPVDVFGCRAIDHGPEINQLSISGIEEGLWDDVLIMSWNIEDLDNDLFDTGARILLHQNSSETSFFPIASCDYVQGGGSSDNGFTCTWSTSNDLPIFDVTGMEMHVQVFVQSLNNSPEADVTMKYFDSILNFTVELEDLNANNGQSETAGAADFGRSIAWGFATIVAITLLAIRLWKTINEDEFLEEREIGRGDFILNPFLSDENE